MTGLLRRLPIVTLVVLLIVAGHALLTTSGRQTARAATLASDPNTPPGEVIVKDTTDRPSCTGFRSQTTPPKSIRVLITSSTPHRIVTVPFQQYVQEVLPNEWLRTWDPEALRAGAIAVKSYAWYWVNHYGGYYQTRSPATCFDVTDDTRFQVYRAGSADPRTTAAVQQTWSIVARTTEHLVRQTFYICSLPYTSSTKCSTQGPKETCGQSANGNQLSQYGSQACAVAGKRYREILQTYYGPNLELGTVSMKPASRPGAGQVALAASGVTVAYRITEGVVLGTGQSVPDGPFGSWRPINPGPEFVGQPVVLLAPNKTLVVYARTADGHILGNGQPAPGAAFTGWSVMGGPDMTFSSDPTAVLTGIGGLGLYVTGTDGQVWGTAQPRLGAAFSPWTRLSTDGDFSGKPAVLTTATGPMVIYARHDNAIWGAGQSRTGGPFSPFAQVGTNELTATGDPTALQFGDGTLSVYVAGMDATGTAVWCGQQPAPGTAFGEWRQLTTDTTYSYTPAVYSVSPTGPVVAYVASGEALVGAQALTPASTFSPFAPIGTDATAVADVPDPAGGATLLVTSDGAMHLYVLSTDGGIWLSSQSHRGSAFGPWAPIGH